MAKAALAAMAMLAGAVGAVDIPGVEDFHATTYLVSIHVETSSGGYSTSTYQSKSFSAGADENGVIQPYDWPNVYADTVDGDFVDVCEHLYMYDDSGSLTECCIPASQAAYAEACAGSDIPTLCEDAEEGEFECSDVDTSSVGTYFIEYSAQDDDGNSAHTVTVSVSLKDDQAPVIQIVGDDYVDEAELCTDFAEPVVYATDNVDTDITVSRSYAYFALGEANVISGTDGGLKSPTTQQYCTGGSVVSEIDVDVIGDYCITYNAYDSAGNAALPETVVVSVEDSIPPSIEFTYTDGFEEVECADTSLLPSVQAYAFNKPCHVTGMMDGAILYKLLPTQSTYRLVQDIADCHDSATWTNGYGDCSSYAVGQSNHEYCTIDGADQYGACPVACDSCGEADMDAVYVDLNSVGEYVIPYAATDGFNSATEFFTVSVVDTTAPEITCPNDVEISIGDCEDIFKYEFATAYDTCSGNNVEVTQVGMDDIDPSQEGTYYVEFFVADVAGNEVTCTQTVVVAPWKSPLLEFNGNQHMTVEACTGTYIEFGAHAYDENDGDIVSKITVSGDEVDIMTVGTYFVEYDVTSDVTGLSAISITREVVVEDTTLPEIQITVLNQWTDIPQTTSADWDKNEWDHMATMEASYYDSFAEIHATDTCPPYHLVPCVSCPSTRCLESCISYEAEATYLFAEYFNDLNVFFCGDSMESSTGNAADATLTQRMTDLASVCGTYKMTYSVSDAVGNENSAYDLVIVADTLAPVLHLSYDEVNTYLLNKEPALVDSLQNMKVFGKEDTTQQALWSKALKVHEFVGSSGAAAGLIVVGMAAFVIGAAISHRRWKRVDYTPIPI